MDSRFVINPDTKLAELVGVHYNVLLMLEHFGIHMPFADKTIAHTCIEIGISPEVFSTFLSLYTDIYKQYEKKSELSDIQVIVSYLRNSHKYYLEEIYPKIKQLIVEMNRINHHAASHMVEKFFNDYFDEVKEHIDYENKIVFPYILGLYKQLSEHKPVVTSIQYSVTVYKEHHNDIEEKLNDLKSLLIRYLPQHNDQLVRRRLLFSLSELEHDLNIHSKIEDTILIPLVEVMETQIKNGHA